MFIWGSLADLTNAVERVIYYSGGKSLDRGSESSLLWGRIRHGVVEYVNSQMPNVLGVRWL